MYLEVLSAHKDLILEHLKGSYGAHPAPAVLQTATAADLSIAPWRIQGKSRETYLATVKDCSFIISVSVERGSFINVPRGDRERIEQFVEGLRTHAVPVPANHGTFRLSPEGPLCDVTEFIHGYQKRGADLDAVELKDLAETLAKSHLASTRLSGNWAEKKKPVPEGMVHADYRPNNIIFDAHTHKVKAVIDFELAHHNSFAYDIARTILKSFSRYRFHDGQIKMNFYADMANQFIADYSKVRPIGRAEAEAINNELRQRMGQSLRTFNQEERLMSADAMELEISKVMAILDQFDAAKSIAKSSGK